MAETAVPYILNYLGDGRSRGRCWALPASSDKNLRTTQEVGEVSPVY